MARVNEDDARCEALFVSDLQRTDAADTAELGKMASAAIRRFGVRGCASLMAQEFGEHPETAADRMRWVRELVGARR
jgi:hypothetical protein